MDEYVEYYNIKRIYSFIGYVAPGGYASKQTERYIQGKVTKAPGGKRAAKSKKNPGSSAEVFLILEKKRLKLNSFGRGGKVTHN